MTTPTIVVPQKVPSPSKTPALASSQTPSSTASTIGNPLCYDLSSPQNLAAVSSLLNAANLKDSRWLTLEVCRQFQRNACTREEHECKFAHPPAHVDIQYGRVTCCYDSIKGKCQRKDPPCKYLHPPQHLKEQLVQNGRKNLIVKSVQLHLLQQQFMNGSSPNLGGSGYPFLAANSSASSSLLELPNIGVLDQSHQSALSMGRCNHQDQINMLNSLTAADPNQVPLLTMNPFNYLSAYPAANGAPSQEFFSQVLANANADSGLQQIPAKRPALVRDRSNIPSSKESAKFETLRDPYQQHQSPLAAWKQSYNQPPQPPPPLAMMNLLDLNLLTAINLVPAPSYPFDWATGNFR